MRAWRSESAAMAVAGSGGQRVLAVAWRVDCRSPFTFQAVRRGASRALFGGAQLTAYFVFAGFTTMHVSVSRLTDERRS